MVLHVPSAWQVEVAVLVPPTPPNRNRSVQVYLLFQPREGERDGAKRID